MVREPSLALLDRLSGADSEPFPLSDTPAECLSENIRVNLENLLNTRRPFLSFNPRYKELEQSIINYGIDDFSSIWLDSSGGYVQFCQHLQRTISLFESRLKNVSVTLEEDPKQLVRSLKLRIKAELQGVSEDNLISYHANITLADAFLRLTTSKIMEMVDV